MKEHEMTFAITFTASPDGRFGRVTGSRNGSALSLKNDEYNGKVNSTEVLVEYLKWSTGDRFSFVFDRKLFDSYIDKALKEMEVE